jgi:transcriptional regulator with XRE-family HTH domain
MNIEELLQRLVVADREYRLAIKEAQAYGGKLVKEARTSLGLTQRELATKLRVDFTYISKVENGHQAPSKALLRHLAQLMAGEEIEDRHAFRLATA